MKIIPIIKEESTEAEKIKETAHGYRQGLWHGYHKRKTDDYRIDDFHSHMLKMANEWERKYLTQIGTVDKTPLINQIQQASIHYRRQLAAIYKSQNSSESFLGEICMKLDKCLEEWEAEKLKNLPNEPG
ncbi:hypothetical protein [Runella limosa]|uniref:hypothetical protein n=1 Tax=Runella limosa TaxID=370978 RepID=UPI00048E9C81|nr:hypothetical protein [Runella limosa]